MIDIEDLTPPSKLTDDAVGYLDGTIQRNSRGNLRTQEALRIMLTTPKTDFQKQMKLEIQNNKSLLEQIERKTTKNDFREFLRTVLDDERENIQQSLVELRDDPEAYNKTLQGWAKIALPQQKDINVSVEMQEKQDMYSRMYEQYGYSQQIEEAEIIQDPMLQAPDTHADISDPSFADQFDMPDSSENNTSFDQQTDATNRRNVTSGTLDPVALQDKQGTTTPSFSSFDFMQEEYEDESDYDE